jgi:hypothetical protein
MKSMNAFDCGSTGARLMSWFHQLSAGSICRPPKSSFRSTDPVDGPGAGDGDGTGDGEGDGDSDGAVGLLPHPDSTIARLTDATILTRYACAKDMPQ